MTARLTSTKLVVGDLDPDHLDVAMVVRIRQHGVGAVGPAFVQLIRIDHEVFSQDRQAHGRLDRVDESQLTAEVLLVRQYAGPTPARPRKIGDRG